jgi:hypothetical protein
MREVMSPEHQDIVKRVVGSLAADEDRKTALDRYVDRDGELLVQSVTEMLDAVGDEWTAIDVERRLEEEILREFQWRPRLTGFRGALAAVWVRRGAASLAAALSVIATIILALIL